MVNGWTRNPVEQFAHAYIWIESTPRWIEDSCQPAAHKTCSYQIAISTLEIEFKMIPRERSDPVL